MFGYRIRADLSFDPPRKAGHEFSLPSGTVSILIDFGSEGSPLHFGGKIDTKHEEPLLPGHDYPDTVIAFMVDEAADFVRPGVQFGLWYGGTVGSGRVVVVQEGCA